jgi:hypothetical protein
MHAGVPGFEVGLSLALKSFTLWDIKNSKFLSKRKFYESKKLD